MATHYWLDSLGRLIGMVEGDGANVVVENVGLNYTVKKSAANETELAVDSCGSTTDIVPATRLIVRKSGIGVLKVGNSNWFQISKILEI
jgi:hypothetical protein